MFCFFAVFITLGFSTGGNRGFHSLFGFLLQKSFASYDCFQKSFTEPRWNRATWTSSKYGLSAVNFAIDNCFFNLIKVIKLQHKWFAFLVHNIHQVEKILKFLLLFYSSIWEWNESAKMNVCPGSKNLTVTTSDVLFTLFTSFTSAPKNHQLLFCPLQLSAHNVTFLKSRNLGDRNTLTNVLVISAAERPAIPFPCFLPTGTKDS